MPRFGTLDSAQWGSQAPRIEGFGTEPLTLRSVRMLNLAHEVEDIAADSVLPKALHPTIPSYLTIQVMHVPASPWGEFSLAELRIMGRTGGRPRGFVLAALIDNPAAAKELASRWGFPVASARVKLTERHDRIVAEAWSGTVEALNCEMVDRDLISGADVQYVASMHLARNADDGKLVLVQVDPEYLLSRCERGSARVLHCDTEAWRAGRALRLTNPIAASFCVGDVTLPKIRYIVDPERPALKGTTKVAA